MYTPNHFNENDQDFIKKLVSQNPLGTIVSIHGVELEATHIPFMMEDNKIIGHIAR
ncbi:MAG: FMN-binding negative transcriptional regulator, partial [Caulobacterales bacterium]|nr:FMN-binding negative transcriptional regulator [Caulobacterales bacterium]